MNALDDESLEMESSADELLKLDVVSKPICKIGVVSNQLLKIGVGFEGGGPVIHDTGEFGNTSNVTCDDENDDALPDSICSEKPFRRRCDAINEKLDAVAKDMEAATYIHAGLGLSDDRRDHNAPSSEAPVLPQSLDEEDNCTSVTCHEDRRRYDTSETRGGGVA